ncbi:MAG: ribosomal-processing cysteine protease Prp [Lachnospiraceae bacterium]|nr:ribosomal-processing cysteine protease Prp [Candidatus Colinaster scatohippi]
MTEIFFVKSNDRYKGFICHGHAEYAEPGEDIVCSAISALTINTVNSLEVITKDKFDINADGEEGDLSVFFTEPVSDNGNLLMESLELGLTTIASEYGEQFVKVEIQEV